MRSNSFDGLMRAAAAIAVLAGAISVGIAAGADSRDENARIADWRAKRLASLTSETGWLTPIALYWLKEGENSFGRASDRAFSLDDAALAADTGAFVLTEGRVRGAIVFEREGRSWRLDAILEAPGDRELFVMFSDATSGKQTYGAGRFLYVPLPNADRIEVDFNEAFNPPCAFTDFATCPLPPRQNQLALGVDAGELKYERAH
jgi:uncharacterized protein (DUF1684 family)